MIQIKTVQTKTDWQEFIDLPWQIYQGDPNWVPPLKIAIRDMLDVNKNPFFKHAQMHPVLAYKEGKCVGRVVGIIDENYNRFQEEKNAMFGFFEAIQDQTVVNALLDEVSRWAKAKNMETLLGPVNLSTNYEVGLLVEGFNDPPAVMMTYNPKYYGTVLEKWGLTKVKDLFAYQLSGSTQFSERVLNHAERLKKRGSVTFRSINMKDFTNELNHIREIYNDCLEKNWGAVPLDPEEFAHISKDMKQIIDPHLVLIAEVRGKPVGFGLSLPDVNQAFHKIKDGKLLPTGLFKLLWNTKGPGKKRTINRCRIAMFGIKKAFQEVGIGPLLYTEYLNRCPSLGYQFGEASWILEDNKPMNKALEMMCGQRTKVYRVYNRPL